MQELARDLLLAGGGLQLDDANAPEAGAHALDPLLEGGGLLGVGGPDPVLVGLAVLPEPASIVFPVARRQHREVGVSSGLPIQVRELLPLVGIEVSLVLLEDDETRVVKDIQLAVGHGES